MHPGQRLRNLRQQNHLTQSQLAARLGVTEFTVCRYENGQITMPIEAVKKAAAVFDACPAYFLDDSRCGLGDDLEMVEIFRQADRLDPGQRQVVKETLRALLDSMARGERSGADRPAKTNQDDQGR